VEEPQVEDQKDQHNSDVCYQSQPGLVSEKQDVDTDDDTNQCQQVERDSCRSSHTPFVPVATNWSKVALTLF
jgi:hypothetical protein